MFNMNLWKGFKLATMINSSSGLPYNITTGFDDNDDTVSNDRPAGVGRNSARGDGRWDVGGRLSWAFGFGQRKGCRTRRNARHHDSDHRRSWRRRADGRLQWWPEDKRWRMELYLAGTNLFNHVNLAGTAACSLRRSSVEPTSAGAPRKLELGMRFGF